jgi:hypothetical protein
MSPRAATLLLIAVLTGPGYGQEWSVPTGFQGVEFGATREQAEAVLGPLRCRDVRAVTKPGDPVRDRNPAEIAPAHVVCTAGRVASKPPFRDAEYLFDRGKFVAVRFRRAEKLRLPFAEVLSMFEREYGTPTKTIETPRKGLRDELVERRLVPTIYDYVETCVFWTNAPVLVSICSEDRMYRSGRIETSEWWLRKQELLDNLPQQ